MALLMGASSHSNHNIINRNAKVPCTEEEEEDNPFADFNYFDDDVDLNNILNMSTSSCDNLNIKGELV